MACTCVHLGMNKIIHKYYCAAEVLIIKNTSVVEFKYLISIFFRHECFKLVFYHVIELFIIKLCEIFPSLKKKKNHHLFPISVKLSSIGMLILTIFSE